jgi:hypothetical protein
MLESAIPMRIPARRSAGDERPQRRFTSRGN